MHIYLSISLLNLEPGHLRQTLKKRLVNPPLSRAQVGPVDLTPCSRPFYLIFFAYNYFILLPGFKLGQENELSTAVKPAPKTAATDMDLDEVVERKLTFWKNGFNIDDGELRKYDDPENEEFLKAIKSGRAPIHMLNVAPGQAVEVKVDHRMEQDYVKVFKTFGGSGQRLGAPTPSLISSSSSSSSSAGAVASLPGSFPTSSSFSSSTPTAAAITTTSSTPAALVSSATSLNVDESKPITSIQIRLGDGTR